MRRVWRVDDMRDKVRHVHEGVRGLLESDGHVAVDVSNGGRGELIVTTRVVLQCQRGERYQ